MSYLFKAPLFVKQIKTSHAYNYYFFLHSVKREYYIGELQKYMWVWWGGRSTVWRRSFRETQRRSSQDADEVMRETELRKNLEALPETYCLSPTFQNGVLTLRNKYKNELSILCGSQGIWECL